MDHYIDIDVRPDPEFPAHQLMSTLFGKLHRALAARNSNCIGVSFPGVEVKVPHLGTRLRLHGDLASLSDMIGSHWLAGMHDHVNLTPLALVPTDAKHCAVTRVQVKSSPERLRRRLMRRHNLDAQEARQRIPDTAGRIVDLPFIQLHSASTSQTYRVFIEHGPAQAVSVPGEFNTYGLSQGATVPWF